MKNSARVSVSALASAAFLVCFPFVAARAAAAVPTGNVDLQIVVLQGEDAVNIVKNKTAVKPIVEVRDKNKGPGVLSAAAIVAGVTVVFTLPDGGPSGKFANGARSMTVITDSNGRAEAGRIIPRGKGSYTLNIKASYQGRSVTRTINQANFQTVAAAKKAGKVPGSSSNDEVAQNNQNSGQSGQSASVAGGADVSGSSPAANAAGNSLASDTNAVSSSSAAGPDVGQVIQAPPPSVTSASATAAGKAGKAGAGGSAAAAGGHTGLLLGGLAVAGAGAGAAAYTVTSQKSSQPDCSSQANQVENALNNEVSVCGSPNVTYSQCQNAAQNALNALGGLCSCAGGPARINSYPGLEQWLQELQSAASQYGLSVPSSCI